MISRAQLLFSVFSSHIKNLGKPSLLALMLLVLSACGNLINSNKTSLEVEHETKSSAATATQKNGELNTTTYSAHVAFAGGGWRAHTGHSAWIISLLQNQKTLDQAFSKVGTLASNSGGSWFNTMLVYSSSFENAIEAPGAITRWADTGSNAKGWLGQQQTLFDNAPYACKLISGAPYLACVFDHYTGSLKNATYWHKVVENLVFYNNKVTQPLNGQRNTWARNKTLLLAASMLTNNAVLGQVKTEKQYYQACLEPTTPELNGFKGSKCKGTSSNADVTPISFSSLPPNSNDTSLPFLRALPNSANTRFFNLGYTENAFYGAPKHFTSLSNPQVNDTVPVMIAASASSAAAGFAASESVSGHWEVAYLASDEALNFSLDGEVKHLIADGMKAKQLADNKVAQIADGGAVDNSAVAQLVSYLQQNNKADGFNIIAFDNVQKLYTPSGGAAVGVDIANLFGKALDNGDQICSGSYCVTTPDLSIFKLSALTSTPVTWSALESKPAQGIIYTKYQVTTQDNSSFGIKAGSQGTLHAFTAVWPSADTAPTNNKGDRDFKAYGEMLAFINSGLQRTDASGTTGLTYLERAFGVAQ